MTDAARIPAGAHRAAVPQGAPSAARQATMGLGLAAAIVAGWIGLQAADLFLLPWRILVPLAPLLIALQCWLSVGLFIVSHDAMHGSLAPFRPRLNRAVGRLVLLLYAGIWYDDLVPRHFAHHRAPGTVDDPDFDRDGTGPWWRWFVTFFARYFGWGQVLRLAAIIGFYELVLGVDQIHLVLFWALPAILSAIQLFYFGTYLPHRRGAVAFADRHRTRSNDYSYWVSLATCFHFGYHHEHHDDPSVPWWRLPARRLPARRPSISQTAE